MDAQQQRFLLPKPAVFQNLKVTITEIERKETTWGSLYEIEAFDKDANNVLFMVPRKVPTITPSEILKTYRQITARDPTRPIFLTVTARFNPASKKWKDEEIKQLYPSYAQATDAMGFDDYVIYGWNRPDWIPRIYDQTMMLRRLAEPKPVYTWIETCKGSRWVTPAKQLDVKPEHIKAEVWAAICAGATGIAYFTHSYVPTLKEFGVPPENQVALKQINAQVTRLTPVIVAPDSQRKVAVDSGGVRLVWLAKDGAEALTIFAVNDDGRFKEGTAAFSVPGLKAGTEVSVVDENRNLRAEAGRFLDTFAPMAVHIYQIHP